MSGEAGYRAIEDQLRSLHAERERLNDLLLAEERRYITLVADAFNSDRIGWGELYRTYHVVRDNEIPGHLARWNEHIPHTPQAMAYQAKLDPDSEQSWSGQGMDVYLDPGRPPKGVHVAYVLWDDQGRVVKYGFTRSFTNHISHLRSSLTWCRWQAQRCRDRAHALELRKNVQRNLNAQRGAAR